MSGSYKRACDVLDIQPGAERSDVVIGFIRQEQFIRKVFRPWSYKTMMELARAAAYIFGRRITQGRRRPTAGWSATPEERFRLGESFIKYRDLTAHYERLYRNNIRIQLVEAIHLTEYTDFPVFMDLWDIHLTLVLREGEPLSSVRALRYTRFEHNPSYDKRLPKVVTCPRCKGSGSGPIYSDDGFVRQMGACKVCHGCGRLLSERRLTEVLRLHPVVCVLPVKLSVPAMGNLIVVKGQGHSSLPLEGELICGDLCIRIVQLEQLRTKDILPPKDGKVEFGWYSYGSKLTQECFAPSVRGGWYE
ncbi:hypothetical protein KKF84_14250 [Myxococcota bacterium]|nr:hypothetical protein [Myxococcota bacterium]MBU1536484.1 hypothetical protein [Myxococcota bacterium]